MMHTEIKISMNRIDSIFSDIYKGINELYEMGFDDGIVVYMPQYLTEILWHHFRMEMGMNPLLLSDSEATIFGRTILPNYQNNIVVSHPHLPMRKIDPIVIDFI